MKTFNVTVQVDDTVPGAVTAEDVTWTVRAMRGVREVDARSVTTYNSCGPVTPFTSDVPAERCDVKPSSLESSPDAAEEWSIDARIAELAALEDEDRERRRHWRGDEDDQL